MNVFETLGQRCLVNSFSWGPDVKSNFSLEFQLSSSVLIISVYVYVVTVHH